MPLSALQLQVIRRRRARVSAIAPLVNLTNEWFPEQRAFYTDKNRLIAALCGRRAGKTRGGCLAMLLSAATTQGGRFLYLNSTRAECQKLAWYGLRSDGMYSLAMKLRLPVDINASSLTIRFPAIDSWIYFMGADDEAGIRKALGLAYHEVWWDEAQSIPPKLENSIRSVLMPTLLDYGGRLRLTGTPVRNMSGLFHNVTRTDGRQLRKWSVHRWNLLANPYFGKAQHLPDGTWDVIGKTGKRVAGPFQTKEETSEAVANERFRGGIVELQELFGGPEAAPLDSPLMKREAFGEWVKEDALYVFAVHRVSRLQLVYAPARWMQTLVLRVPRLNGEKLEVEEVPIAKFPDIRRAIEDLPEWRTREYFFALGADIGYQDPFAWSLAAWSLKDPALYEVASWGSSHLDQPTQAAILRYICDLVNVGVVAADAGGSALPTVKGWSAEWMSRYGIPLDEMEKTNKGTAIEACNGDIVRGLYRLRGPSPGETSEPPLLEQFGAVQWMAIKTGSGRLVEDPTIPNDIADAGLYVHRRSFAHRFRPEEPKPEPGTPEYYAAIERQMEQEADEEFDIWQ